MMLGFGAGRGIGQAAVVLSETVVANMERQFLEGSCMIFLIGQ